MASPYLKDSGAGSDHGLVAEFLSQRLIARLGAVLFMLSGVLTLLNLALPSEIERHIPVMIGIAVGAMLVGGIAWSLPWHRWPKWSTLPLVPVAFLMISLGGMASLRPWSYAVYWVVVFVWIGVAHPPWMSIKFAPLAGVGYVMPFVVVAHGGMDAFTSVAVVLPVCLLVGESLAWISGMLRQAERLDLRRMTDMEALLDATVSLARQADATCAANLVAELSVRLFRADSAVVLLADGGGTLRGTGGFRWQGRFQALEARWLDQPARAALTNGDVTVHDGGVAGQLTRAAHGAPALFLPLLSSAGALGILMVTFPSGTKIAMDGFASGLARTFATQASLAFERLQATQVLLDTSMRDALTGVGNRRQADTLLEQVKPGDAVAILDLDHFKSVNDRFGHSVGDEVLHRARQLSRPLAPRRRRCRPLRRRRVHPRAPPSRHQRRGGYRAARRRLAPHRAGHHVLRRRRRPCGRHQAGGDADRCRPGAVPGQGRRSRLRAL